MNRRPNRLFVRTGFALCLALIPGAYAGETDDHQDDVEAIELTPAEQRRAGIVTERIARRSIGVTRRLPAEVTINAYRSTRVSLRIPAQVVSRHVRLGEEVAAGRRLVTLSSVEMAEAQGQLIVADQEWRLVRELGKGAVSSRRYTEAEVARQQSEARVLAYGMSRTQVQELLNSGDVSAAVGAFDLTAPQAGTIVSDEFVLGELIEPGRVLFDIVDESIVWVDARTGGGGLPDVAPGSPVGVLIQDIWLPGRVVGQHHHLEETTRTQGLRVEVPNEGHVLHPGQFVEVEIELDDGHSSLAVPNEALTLIEGVQSVFVSESGGVFRPQPVEVGLQTGTWTAVESGLSPGDEVAVNGVFHLKSLLLKSSLGDGHGH